MGRLRVLSLVFLSGCYLFSMPPDKRTPIKPVPGATVTFESEHKVTTESCSDSRSSCDYTKRGRRANEGIRTERFQLYTATYDGKEITEAELEDLVDPKWNDNWKKIESERSTCKLSLIPTVIGFAGLMAAGGVVLYAHYSGGYNSVSDYPSGYKTAVFATSGVALGGALLSIPIGGFSCMRANKLAAQMDVKYADVPGSMKVYDDGTAAGRRARRARRELQRERWQRAARCRDSADRDARDAARGRTCEQ